ncbi:hypothetical protein BT67DRAFT_53931 [Trichocladium antarcticum]|uniref:Uncharacterized protein n=1 Tax=Trichocladium antarcticum TaxID=1450529 RepID=A0AAN6ZCU5_9PEZI|nr:hypothetical protein BT67DRAFT_53931 [Trichocladium antarcticum]
MRCRWDLDRNPREATTRESIDHDRQRSCRADKVAITPDRARPCPLRFNLVPTRTAHRGTLSCQAHQSPVAGKLRKFRNFPSALHSRIDNSQDAASVKIRTCCRNPPTTFGFCWVRKRLFGCGPHGGSCRHSMLYLAKRDASGRHSDLFSVKEAVGSREPAQVGRPASLLRNSRDCPRVRNVFCRLWLMIREGVRANPCGNPMQVQADPGSPSLVVRRQSLTGRMHFAVVGILRLGAQVAICAADKHPQGPSGHHLDPRYRGLRPFLSPFPRSAPHTTAPPQASLAKSTLRRIISDPEYSKYSVCHSFSLIP